MLIFFFDPKVGWVTGLTGLLFTSVNNGERDTIILKNIFETCTRLIPVSSKPYNFR